MSTIPRGADPRRPAPPAGSAWPGNPTARGGSARPRAVGLAGSTPAVLLVLVALLLGLCGCGSFGSGGLPAPKPATTTGPPPGASQAPGPPLATATAGAAPAVPGGPVDRADPAAVAADCFTRWQSFDARTDSGPGAGVDRAHDCLTADFAATLGAGGTGGADADAEAWQDLRAAGVHSQISVLATTPLGGIDTTATGRVVLQLNVRRQTVTGDQPAVVAVSTPAVTLLRQQDGTWLVAGADLASVAGDAPGR
ncbi:hypothetical protein MXD59_04615 [Frankia sp. Ag45/Mut15]|uniref:SnoaL-like domain-containing protein n=1 Tax=Frankia umida TaxID=573489 RepID=A0ABT0JU39_9ACTN|nr:hypothetical protein [Frankia umida]MCK9875072.1 hypothetical protein [Frankia umida]